MERNPQLGTLPNSGWSIGRTAWRLGVSIHEYRELEAGERVPSWETCDRICKLSGWPQTFVTVL
jgi:DNA-binding XRE family transcriptional regulator